MSHREIEELLPWYLNRTLNEDERRTVGDHLQECAECARELSALEEIQAAVRNTAQETAEPSPFLLTRAVASIEEYERKGAGRRWGWLDWWRPIPKLARVVLIAQLAAVIALGSYILASRERRPYTTASSGIPQGRGARIAVMFEPGISEERIRQMLRKLEASIVSGPSAQGLYSLELPAGKSSAEDVSRALEMLRENREAVRFAEKAQ